MHYFVYSSVAKQISFLFFSMHFFFSYFSGYYKFRQNSYKLKYNTEFQTLCISLILIKISNISWGSSRRITINTYCAFFCLQLSSSRFLDNDMMIATQKIMQQFMQARSSINPKWRVNQANLIKNQEISTKTKYK